MIIEHPDIEQRLRHEVLNTVGSRRSPTSEDFRKMKYLRSFLNGMIQTYVCIISLMIDIIRGAETLCYGVSGASIIIF
jgi:hypothetical protein